MTTIPARPAPGRPEAAAPAPLGGASRYPVTRG
jgi:hypothetical protein